MSNYPPSNLNFGPPGNPAPYPVYPPGNNYPAFPAPYNYPTTGYPPQQPMMDHSGYPNSGNPQNYPQPGGQQNYPHPGGVQISPTPGGQQIYPQPGGQQNYPQPGGVQISPTPGGQQNYPQPGGVQISPTPGGQQNYPQPGGVQISPTPGGQQNYPGVGPGPDGGMPGAGLQPEICPTAPDIGQIEKIPGYEGITFEEVVLPPPTFPSWEPDQRDHKPLQNLPVLSEEEVRDAVTQYASENCCYGSKPAREMKVKEIEMMSAFHYKLETFAEKRESAWKFEPYTGQSIDGPANGPAPSPWDVTVPPSDYFKDGKKKVEVPHTAFVKPCHACVGIGRVRCSKCDGYGRKQCTWCEGRGRRKRFDQEEQCDSCGGSGFDRCIRCSGSGQVKCPTCNGKGNLKAFVELTVSWANHVDDYISETSSMPKELVKQVTGQVAYEEENPRVFPIMHAPDVAVRNASNELVTKHGSAFTNERILKQRQCLRIIPIGHVKYEYNDKVDEFFVYGYEHKVYFKSYPQKCCCCTIM
ncbi:protein SSUH2 homolog [Argiope bruennichi]|uniref:protein SSUH2 homolog n=1 Tax=Argiope bruennichi TaxID=94029 RepID=UPI0024946958|nr:protein SSUH2 homolog [Argiope bruennichi]